MNENSFVNRNFYSEPRKRVEILRARFIFLFLAVQLIKFEYAHESSSDKALLIIVNTPKNTIKKDEKGNI